MVIVDDRAGSNRYPALLSAVGLKVTLGRLEYGDFTFIGRGPSDAPVTIGIEHKRLDDLLQSITSGRLSGHQLPGLIQSYDHVYLMVEGIYRPCPDSGVLQVRNGKSWVDHGRGARRWMYRDVENYLNTLDLKAAIHVRKTSTSEESARLIQALYSWWNRGWDDHKSHLAISQAHAINRPTDAGLLLSRPSLVRRVANELDGIGWERSAAVARHFPTVIDMVLADVREWTKVPGIGRVTATRIVQALNGGSDSKGK